jgi:hypothetical protein
MYPGAALTLLQQGIQTMTMMPTIVAVALGLVPIQTDGTVGQLDATDVRRIGHYRESVDDTGTTHLQGMDRASGRPYHITINPFGRVEGSIGDTVVTFTVQTRA